MQKPANSGLLVRMKDVYNEWNLGLFGLVDVVFLKISSINAGIWVVVSVPFKLRK